MGIAIIIIAGLLATATVVLVGAVWFDAIINTLGAQAISPSLPRFQYDGGYDHLDAKALADRVDSGEELPDGEYEEGHVTLPKAVL